MSILVLTFASFASWFFSTLAGGGTPLILIPVIATCLGATAVAPVITVGMLIGHFQRLFLYWRSVRWQLMWWYLPGAIVGAGLGAFIFTIVKLEWLSILLGLFLLISIASYKSTADKPLFPVRSWYFLPAGFIFAFLSGLIGSTGPMLNPFYLNYGLDKEETIATKSAHLLVVHIIKILAYAKFGALTWLYLDYGVIIGLAAFPGNWLGQMALQKVSERRFRQFLTSFVALSGILILWQERKFWAFW